MTHAFLTVAIPFPASRADAAEAAIRVLGNPPGDDVRTKLRKVETLHFVSAIVVRDTGPDLCHLLFEISADGSEEQAARDVAGALGAELDEILSAARVPRRGPPLTTVLLDNNLRLGGPWWRVWWRPAGLPFSGVPGMTAARIRRERDLAKEIAENMRAVLESQVPPADKLREVRDRLWKDGGRWKWAFTAEPAPILDKGVRNTPVRALASVIEAASALLLPLLPVPFLFWWWLGLSLHGLLGALAASVLLLAALGAAAVAWLRRLEKKDRPDDGPPDAGDLLKVMEPENLTAQNLLAAVSVMKPGRFRRMALRVAFTVVGRHAAWTSRPGFLQDLGVIHFARWFLLPGTGRLVFLSNFSNSWESYLEDFIVKTPKGITPIWSNTAGFPRTRLLFLGGAEDGTRLRRWARRQQQPVRFWYSAYPDLTMARIRTNAAIREGVAGARPGLDPADWLALFGGAPRPAFSLNAPEVPTLVFGGLRKHRFAHCFVLSLPGKPAKARSWLASVRAQVTFGEAAGDTAMALGLSAEGLRRLGVADDDLATFPVAFQHGMADDVRAQVLNDTGRDHPRRWAWGRPGTADVFLVLYNKDEGSLDDTVRSFKRDAEDLHGLRVRESKRLQPLPSCATNPDEAIVEPFGFVDGVSQPVIRDTPKARRAYAADHVVNPGEVVLGYPDNSGYFPSMPSVAAGRDPAGLLSAPVPDTGAGWPRFPQDRSAGRRDLGRDGTFLVVRHLDQYRWRLNRYVLREAGRLRGAGQAPRSLSRKHVAALLKAKMVGRWPDGRSLVRHPDPRLPNGRKPEPPDNDFRYAREDPQGLRCPFGAHVRRANPRDAFGGASQDAVAIANRHRILRVGRAYEAEGEDTRPGLMFMCLNADIERQFEFIQRNWVCGRNFHDTADEVDPLLGTPRPSVFTIPTPHGSVQLQGLPDFVRVRGGGYFFMPGRRALRYLVEGAPQAVASPARAAAAEASAEVEAAQDAAAEASAEVEAAQDAAAEEAVPVK